VSGLNAAPGCGNLVLKMNLQTGAAGCALAVVLVVFSVRPARAGLDRLSVGFTVSATFALLLLLSGVDAVWATSNAVMNAIADIHLTSQKILSVKTLITDVRQAETGQRGYLLTGDPRYLRTFRLGQREFEQLLRASNVQNAALLSEAQLKFDQLNLTISLEQQGHHEDALRLVRTSRGLKLMEEIEAQGAVVTDELHARLVQQTHERRAGRRNPAFRSSCLCLWTWSHTYGQEWIVKCPRWMASRRPANKEA
jgi:CHASE3 domain sensor protein